MLNTPIPLQVYAVDADGNRHPAGSTVASRSVGIPVGDDSWMIEPLGPVDWDALIGLTREMLIPGLGAAGQMTDAVLDRVSRLGHLTSLDLHGSAQLTDSGLQHLARLPNLRHLNVSCPQITDQGLEVLRHLPELRSLRIVHQEHVSDAGFTGLPLNRNLRTINLMGTGTGDGIIKALSGNPHLRRIYTGDRVTDAGLGLFQQFPQFKRCQDGEPALSLLAESLPVNGIWLGWNDLVTDAGVAALANLDGLHSLGLFATPAVTASGLKSLLTLPNLAWLAYCSGLCTDEAMDLIGRMPRLRFLMCQDAAAGDDGFAALARSASLQYIWGRRCHNLTGRGFAALAGIPGLRGLSVSCRHVNDEALSLLPSFPSLREFMPMDVPDDGFRHVAACPQLETLECMYSNGMTDTATESIAGLSGLKSFRAWNTRITDRSLAILAELSALERLGFERCPGLTNTGLGSVAHLPRLREISLDSLDGAVFPARVRVNYRIQ